MNDPILAANDAGSSAPVECRVCADLFYPVAGETRCPSCDRLADDRDDVHARAGAMVADANGGATVGHAAAPRPTNPAPRWPRTFVAIVSEPSIKRLEEAVNRRLGAIEDAGGQVVEVTPYVDGDEGWNAALIVYTAAEEIA